MNVSVNMHFIDRVVAAPLPGMENYVLRIFSKDGSHVCLFLPEVAATAMAAAFNEAMAEEGEKA